MYKILPIILVVVLSGCAITREDVEANIDTIVSETRKNKVYLPSGHMGYSVFCSNQIEPGSCFYIIGAVCEEKGYEVIDKREQTDLIGINFGTNYLISCKNE